MCSQTVLLAPEVTAELDYSLHHKYGTPATKVPFPQFGDSLGKLNGLTDEEKLTYCGPRIYSVSGNQKKQALKIINNDSSKS